MSKGGHDYEIVGDLLIQSIGDLNLGAFTRFEYNAIISP
jgi:hypothetical protein